MSTCIDLYYKGTGGCLVIDGKSLKLSYAEKSKHARATRLIMQFLEDGGYLNGVESSSCPPQLPTVESAAMTAYCEHDLDDVYEEDDE